ncbi:MAG: hypothetical protein KDD62_05450, partial [Bdellovibrionales bacterium]|nr:hypothetical protein [Bdellovibrionales bacterium]
VMEQLDIAESEIIALDSHLTANLVSDFDFTELLRSLHNAKGTIGMVGSSDLNGGGTRLLHVVETGIEMICQGSIESSPALIDKFLFSISVCKDSLHGRDIETVSLKLVELFSRLFVHLAMMI